MLRNLRFLTDHGYISEVYPEPADGANLRDLVQITPAGKALLSIRS
jgi:DNA-binding PadR family transcriptional regulator